VHYLFKLDDVVSDGSAHFSFIAAGMVLIGKIDFSLKSWKEFLMCQNRVVPQCHSYVSCDSWKATTDQFLSLTYWGRGAYI